MHTWFPWAAQDTSKECSHQCDRALRLLSFLSVFFVIPIFIYIDSSSFVPNKIFSMFVSTKVRRDIVLWLFLSLNWNDKQQQTNGVNDEVERRKKNYDIFHIFFGSKMLVDISSALDHQNCCTRSFLQKWRYLFF